ncbi:hypothetical protein ACP93_13450 [Xanthomonas sp. NCPPB 1128]|uniref:hypothetical protein n=1 Tax=Xanthomonas sp. NCPPB 1128 TaxID=1775876 RepID=UPI00065AEB7B|nr:hypothetical protein [Xanthomonas sp. NCPPB 1128]KMM74985.1 hypothetical protein ACP93_13450 [Xanthomonas sp. NCPPB 1128]
MKHYMDGPSQFQSNLSQSASDFQTRVWPLIAAHPRIGGGDLHLVEANVDTALALDMDTLAGIDAWQVVGNRIGMRSIASRVQWGQDRRTFSIRYRKPSGAGTEYEKRLAAIKQPELGLSYPHLTVQAFLDTRGGRVFSVAAITTQHLILQAEKLLDWGRMVDGTDRRFGLRRLQDGTEFLYMSWDYLQYTELAQHLTIFEAQETAAG